MSVRQVATRAGVSAATVSRVINNDPRVSEAVRQRVLSAVNQTRYVPKIGRRNVANIAFAYTGDNSLGSPFDAALMQGMGERMEEFGFDLMILNAARSCMPGETFSQMFMRKGVRGAVLRSTTQTRYLCEQIIEEGFPAVVVGDRSENPKVSFIYSDSRVSSREAVEHLINLGHRRIACCVNIVDDSDHHDRMAGYFDALRDAGIPEDPRLVMRVPAYREGGVQLIRKLVHMEDRPTALYITDPMPAVGAMSEVQRQGWTVPGDLSIVGFDDGEVRHLVYPRMTAVVQDAPRMGREAFAALNTLLGRSSRSKAIQVALPTVLEIHGSTGRPGVQAGA